MNRKFSLLMAVCLVLCAVSRGQSPLDLVHPLVGTAADGQTFPSVAPPFAMTQWTPVTRLGENKCVAPYYYNDSKFFGVRGSHFLSGSCTQDYGSMQLLMGAGSLDLRDGAPSTPFRHEQEHASPYEYSIALEKLRMNLRFTGKSRAGVVQFQSQSGGHHWMMVENNARSGDGETLVDPEKREVRGRNLVRRLYAGQGRPAGFSGYFVIQFDREYTATGSFSNKSLFRHRLVQPADGPLSGIVLDFELKSGESVTARIGTSFVSYEEARRNLQSEIGSSSYEQIRSETRGAWEEALRRVEIRNRSSRSAIFYTALYHSMMLPRTFSDVSGTYPSFGGGKTVERAADFTYYCDFSAWDTFRALHPLLTIIEPGRDVEMIRSLVAKGQQGGFLPIFPAWNSYTSEMVGDHAVAIIGDAMAKGLPGFDREQAYTLMLRNADSLPDPEAYKDGRGRRALDSYLQYGYIPLEDHVPDAFHKDEQVSRTLEYAFDDFVVSQAAELIGRKQDASRLAKRSENWRNVLDPQSGFARGRHQDGSWASPFDPAKPASYVTEAFPFQYTFFVPQNVKGLISFEGGAVDFTAKLDQLFSKQLYEHGNEPSHHIAYLYDYAGQPWKTQKQVSSILRTQYKDAPDGLAGNDDAGQMSAWYVMSALGLYQVTPGIPVYAIGSPQFEQATLRLESGRTFTIRAKGAGSDAPYIQSATLNGKPFQRFWLRHSELTAGGELVFQMGPKPNLNWANVSPLP